MSGLTASDCDKWDKDKTHNPKTGRQIKPTSNLYSTYSKLCRLTVDDCNAWKKDPLRHPISKRKLNTTKTQKGMYAQIASLCLSMPAIVHSQPAVLDVVKEASPMSSVSSKASEKTVLMEAMRRALAPVLHRSDTLALRRKFAQIMRNMLNPSTLHPCLQVNKRTSKYPLFLASSSDVKTPIVRFDQRIGSKSMYGMAYLNVGSKGFGRLLKFSCKIMPQNKDNKQEVKLLGRMSELAEKGACPNMPITYAALTCDRPCLTKGGICPPVSRSKSGYIVVINELADSDLQTWFLKSYDENVYESIIMQIIFAVHAFHQLNYTHNDCHLGNFLVHKIKAGGYWRYQVDGRNVYVPNCGYLLVLWDPGLALGGMTSWKDDFTRPLKLIGTIASKPIYVANGLKPMSDQFIESVIAPIVNKVLFAWMQPREFVSLLLDDIKQKTTIKMASIQVDGRPPGYLMNVKPYTLKL